MLTGCDLYGYSLVSISFLTGQSNIAGCLELKDCSSFKFLCLLYSLCTLYIIV